MSYRIERKGKQAASQLVAIALTQEEVIALKALIGELPGYPLDEDEEWVDTAFETVWQRLKAVEGQFDAEDEDAEAFANGWVKHWINSKRKQA